MIRKENVQKVKQEINDIRRALRTTQKDITLACELVKLGKFNPDTLVKKEKRFRTMRRKLSELQEILNSMLEGQEPVKVETRRIRRPSTESRLTCFCEV